MRPLLFLVVSCFPLLSLTCSCLPAAEASGASPAGLAILIFLCLALGFPCFCLRSLVIPCFLLLCFHVLLASLLIGFPGVPSLSLAFPCFLFPALAFSSFICKEFGDDMFHIYWWWHVPHLFGKGSVIKWGTCHHWNISRSIWNMSSPNFFPNTSRTCHHQLCWAMLALAGFC